MLALRPHAFLADDNRLSSLHNAIKQSNSRRKSSLSVELAMTPEEKQRLGQLKTCRERGLLPWSHFSSQIQQQRMAENVLDFLLFLIQEQNNSFKDAISEMLEQELVNSDRRGAMIDVIRKLDSL